MDFCSVKETNWTVYRHTSPSGKVYIGITKQDVKIRWSSGSGYRPCVLFYKAIKKYGWNNIKHEILFTNLSEDRAKSLEINLIRHYKALGISYNITDGGEGCLGRIASDETKDKIRKGNLGKVMSVESRHKLSISKLGKPNYAGRKPRKERLSEDARKNIGKGHLGLKYNRTKEWREKVTKVAK